MWQVNERLLFFLMLLRSCSSAFGEREGGEDELQETSAIASKTPELVSKLAGKQYIFGFSTGYVGSTTFSREGTYKDGASRRRTLFEFERFHRNSVAWNHTHDDENNTMWYLVDKSLARQHQLVASKSYLPHWKEEMQNHEKTKLVSLGHDSLYYYPALCTDINETSMLFVRTRRPREESARSMVYMVQENGKLNMSLAAALLTSPNIMDGEGGKRWSEHWWFYNPLINKKAVALKLDKEVWLTLNQFQMG
jgi:hypothetical protein